MCEYNENSLLKSLILNQNTKIDIKDCYEKTGIDSILKKLDEELVGLENVKIRIREISSVS